MKEVTAKSYTLRDDNGGWLGQIILTNDGAFMSITDWGNFNFAWRSHGEGDFRKFIIGLDPHYFASKMRQGSQYLPTTSQIEKCCQRYTEKILPAIQKVLKEEIESEKKEVA